MKQEAVLAKVTLKNLGTIVREKRGSRGLRTVASEIGTSAPTLSRIESGKMPDLQTFGKLCRWLGLDPAGLLDVRPKQLESGPTHVAVAHLKAHREIDPQTAKALANAILKAQMILHDAPEEVRESDGEGF